MKTLEEEARDMQAQDEQVDLLYTSALSLRMLDIFPPPTVLCLNVSCNICGFLFFFQAQTTLKVYSMNSDRLNRNLETAGEENTLLQESNAQVRRWWLFSCLHGDN